MIGKKNLNSRRKAGTSIRELSGRVRIRIILEGLSVGVFAVWLCYRSLAALPVSLPVAACFWLIRYKEEVEKNKQAMRLHFRDFLTAVHMAVRSGYSLENAVRSGYRDTMALYGASDPLVRELDKLIHQLEYQISVEKLFLELGRNTGIYEIRIFSEMVSITKRTGGNLGKVLSDTWRCLSRRMDTEMEIETLLAAKKYEQSVMSLMPAGMIVYLRFTFPGFVEHLYGNTTGAIIMSAALFLYLLAFALGRRMIRIEV
ncbi:MAG: hypothetical protein Q4B03_02880 [Lachnospiraceae bacterium]|nr:hypothetical protein [Lachnospiraceae bacterium]